MKGSGQDDPTWAIAVEGKPSPMLQIALTAVCRSGGEGYLSFSIATPTGEGVTTPLTFTRQRRSTTVGSMHVL